LAKQMHFTKVKRVHVYQAIFGYNYRVL